jgi:DNA-binding GntR family transcriptional regulator
MQIIRSQPSLVDQVHEAILGWIEDGRYGKDARLIQEDIAETLGVSRQPVQQALLLLRNMGVLINAPGRGLMVAPLDKSKVRDMYEIRSSLDALASGMAAERGAERARAEGKAIIDSGWKAVESKVISELVSADMRFHHFVYELSGNRMVAETVEPHWAYLRRVMGEVLLMGASANEIWAQHASIMQAIADGNVGRAQEIAKEHIDHSGVMVLERLGSHGDDQESIAKAL